MVSNLVRIRARSFSKVKGASEEKVEVDKSAFREVVGAVLVAFKPMPTTRL
jgi:hypothetical protein